MRVFCGKRGLFLHHQERSYFMDMCTGLDRLTSIFCGVCLANSITEFYVVSDIKAIDLLLDFLLFSGCAKMYRISKDFRLE